MTHKTPRRLWFTPMPNQVDPLIGGALFNIQPRDGDGDLFTIGLDLGRLLQLQVALANTMGVVIARSLNKPPAPAPITEDEISLFISQLDQTTEEGTTNE